MSATEHKTTELKANKPTETSFTPERIAELADLLTVRMNRAIGEIQKINDKTHLLSLNARIEAARAGGEAGAAFGVVASAIKDLSEKTSVVAVKMANETQEAIGELEKISKALATNIRGTRLTDIALNSIELIDRSLYERSCNVRGWATDSILADSLASSASGQAAKRLGSILSSYPSYADIVLCDMQGRVVANGRPQEFRSEGQDCSRTEWFTSAMNSHSGEDYGFQSVHTSELINNQRTVAFSSCVRSNGESHGSAVGVLGVLFHWDNLAQTIINNAPLSPDEKAKTRVCIVNDSGLVLADSRNGQLRDTLDFPDRQNLFTNKKGYVIARYEGIPCCIAHANSPGYANYSSGWHAILIQPLGKATTTVAKKAA